MSAGNATIDSARTPLASFYTDPEQLTRESRTVLVRSWQYVGHTGQPHIPLFSDVISRGCGGGDFGTQVASR